MNSALMIEQGDKWNALGKQIEGLTEERDETALEIERRAMQIGEHLRTTGHRRPYFTRTSESPVLTGFNGDGFHFTVYDHYEDSYGLSFTLTPAELANPMRTIENLKAQNRDRDLSEAQEAAERANSKVAALQKRSG